MQLKLGDAADIAFHSTCQLEPGGPVQHLALVDMALSPSDLRVDSVVDFLKQNACDQVLIVHSGRSCHLYGLGLFDGPQWLRLMSGLLGFSSRRGIGTPLHPMTIAAFLQRVCDLEGNRDRVRSETVEFIDEFVAPAMSIQSSLNGVRPFADSASELQMAVRVAAWSLLQNAPDPNELVDSRWIAHRLVAGYSALRWTGNQEHYLAEPRILRTA
ncbi:MAG: hypothetical protein KAY59_02190 [Acidobacteria bacterium]|nr:hypothetical protein [Acidobacteriota bacterium]